MKQAIIFLLTGVATALLAGCSSTTKSASADSGKILTSYTVPQDDANLASAPQPGWSLGPAVEP